MIEKTVAEKFLNKKIGVVRDDGGKKTFSRGTLLEVTDNAIVLEYYTSLIAVSLESIQSIRELVGCP